MATKDSFFTDSAYLRAHQYADASNLDARIALHLRFSANPYGWMRWVFDCIVARAPDGPVAVLEFGCGPGHLWRENVHRIPSTWEITLSDLSPGMIAEARHALGESGRAFTLQAADMQEPPFDADQFDIIIANHMLYHVPDRPRAIAAARRLLRPGGLFFAATNGAQHMRELADLCVAFDPALDIWRGGATRSFSLENGAEQLSRSFENVALEVYEDSLLVTEAEPLIAYIDSMAHMESDQLQRFGSFVNDYLDAQNGALHITKSSGLFIAW